MSRNVWMAVVLMIVVSTVAAAHQQPTAPKVVIVTCSDLAHMTASLIGRPDAASVSAALPLPKFQDRLLPD